MQEVKACLQVVMLFVFKGEGLCVCVLAVIPGFKKSASKDYVLYEIN